MKTGGCIIRTRSKVWLFLVCTEFKDLLLITWIQFLLHRNQILMVNTIWLNFGYFRNISCFAQRQNYWILGSGFAQRKNWICYLLFFRTCQHTETKLSNFGCWLCTENKELNLNYLIFFRTCQDTELKNYFFFLKAVWWSW